MLSRLLVLGRDDGWRDVVRREATALQAEVTAAEGPEQAVALLAGNNPRFSHFLLDPAAAGDALPVLLQLAAEATPDMPRLVLRETEAAVGWLAGALKLGARRKPAPLETAEVVGLLAAGQLGLRYQPIVRMADRRPVAVEGLARLAHPTRGTLAPAAFVPQLEAAGEGWALTEQVVARAFADWGDGRLEADGLSLSLNVPLDVLLLPELAGMLETACARYYVRPGRVVLELTETQIVVDPAALEAPMRVLRGLGVRMAIDDIAPVTHDPSALLYLPFSAMKLDRAAVRDAADNADAAAFVRQSVATARAAGMALVAEGVEDAAIWAMTRAAGVDQAQGFRIARPLPMAAMPAWRQDWMARRED